VHRVPFAILTDILTCQIHLPRRETIPPVELFVDTGVASPRTENSRGYVNSRGKFGKSGIRCQFPRSHGVFNAIPILLNRESQNNRDWHLRRSAKSSQSAYSVDDRAVVAILTTALCRCISA